MKPIKPNFFIIGAPKCGTTALYHYLLDHPEICFSKVKEPSHFCTDFRGICDKLTDEEYLKREFQHCTVKTPAIGEASVWYLYSNSAVKNIFEFNPDSKIIIMLRDPVNMVQSLHSQLLFTLDEDVEDFESAWNLQHQRLDGINIPKTCREPSILQYRKIGSYSSQLKRVFSIFPRNQIKVILFDDFVNNTKKVYDSTLNFLEVSSFPKTDFPKINENKVYRFNFLARITNRHPSWAYKLTKFLRNKFGIQRLGIQKYILDNLTNYFNLRQVKRFKLPDNTRKMLLNEFYEDISETEEILNVDLSKWKISES